MKWVSFVESYFPVELLKKIEKSYNVVYVGRFRKGSMEVAEHIFYQPNPKLELGHSHALSVYEVSLSLAEITGRNPGVFVSNGIWVEDGAFGGIVIDNCVVVSCGYFIDTTKGFIDGDNHYSRSSSSDTCAVPIKLKALGEYALRNPDLPYDRTRFKDFDYSPYLRKED